jgi:hypothetical protein
MRLTLLAALVTLSVLMTACGSAHVAARPPSAPPPVTLSGYGRYTFASLGYGANVFEPFPVGFTYPEMVFLLPKAIAREGGDNWYVLRLHYRVEVDPVASDAVNFGASSNQVGAVLIRVAPTKDRDGLRIMPSGALMSTTPRTVSGHVYEGRYADFLAKAGVRPGSNTIEFVVAEGHKRIVTRLTVYPDSSIERTRNGPAHLRLRVQPRRQVVHVGDTFRVSARVEGAGHRTSHDIVVALDTSLEAPTELRPVGRAWRIASLQPARSAVHTLVGRAGRRGYFPVRIWATSASAQKVQAVTVVVK